MSLDVSPVKILILILRYGFFLSIATAKVGHQESFKFKARGLELAFRGEELVHFI